MYERVRRADDYVDDFEKAFRALGKGGKKIKPPSNRSHIRELEKL